MLAKLGPDCYNSLKHNKPRQNYQNIVCICEKMSAKCTIALQNDSDVIRMAPTADTKPRKKKRKNASLSINLDELKNKIRNAPNIFYQFIFTYCVMIAIALLSIIIYLLTQDGKPPHDITADIWSILINSFTPTTITFTGVMIFSQSFLEKHKFRGVILEILVVCMALAYIAFVSVNDLPPEEMDHNKLVLLYIVRYINLLLMPPAILIIPGILSTFFNQSSQEGSDGQIASF